MTLLSSMAQAFRNLSEVSLMPTVQQLHTRDLYGILYRYYMSNGLYDDVRMALSGSGISEEKITELRNPCHRVVEFYTSKLWPGTLPEALPLKAKREAIIDPIRQVWTWSNWAQRKQLAARWYALFGELIIKVVERPEADGEEKRVYFEVIDPRVVSEITLNERGYVTRIRLDIPIMVEEAGELVIDDPQLERRTHTEIWTKNRVRIWKHTMGVHVTEAQLGRGTERDQNHDLGFIPFVYAPFYDIGEKRGIGSFVHALSKIDEANRSATRLHDLLFRHNEVTWALAANARDASNRPLPAPLIGGRRVSNDVEEEPGVMTWGGEKFIRLPGTSSLQPLVPSIAYGEALNILNALLKDLEQDLPELRYYRLNEMGQITGIALRTMLGDAVDRATEARGNAFAALQRANAIALSMGQRLQIPAFSQGKIGTYANGDFDHLLAGLPMFPSSPTEVAGAAKAWVDVGLPLNSALRMAGVTQDEIDQIEKDREEAREKQVEQAKSAAQVEDEITMDREKRLAPLREEQAASALAQTAGLPSKPNQNGTGAIPSQPKSTPGATAQSSQGSSNGRQ